MYIILLKTCISVFTLSCYTEMISFIGHQCISYIYMPILVLEVRASKTCLVKKKFHTYMLYLLFEPFKANLVFN